MKKVLVSFIFVSLCLVTMSLPASAATYTSGNTTITTSGTTITVSPKPGTDGAMDNYNYSFHPSWVTSSMTAIVIEEGVTHIGAYAFMKESNNLTRVNIPTSVTSIGGSAFALCTKMEDIYYAGSPNEWASITFADIASNPYGDSNASNRKFHFYGCEFTTKTLTLEPGITTVNAYAFYNATIDNLNIPGTVSQIGAYAFRCAVKTTVCVNRTTPPTAGTNAITYGGSAKLYVPSGATAAYNNVGKPWKYSTTEYGPGATAQAVSGTLNATYGSGVTWALDQDGILTFDASNPSASKSVTLGAGSSYPWGNFRRLVHKIKLKGEITALGDALAYHWFMSGIILDQNTVPTCSNNIGSSSITSTGTTAYNSIFNPCHPLTMEVPISTILDNTNSANLSSAPWSDEQHWQVTVSEEVLISETDNNAVNILSAIKEKVTAPFTLRLGRTLSTSYYNTFCSPLDLDAATISATFGDTDIQELVDATFDESKKELTLTFDIATEIEKGKPYLIKPSIEAVNPSFSNVDPGNITDTPMEIETDDLFFKGILSPLTLLTDNEHFLFLKADNEIYWAKPGTLKGMRAYWLLKSASARMANAHVNMNFNGETPIEMVLADNNLPSVRKVIHDGQLLIIRDGKTYNAQGILIQ